MYMPEPGKSEVLKWVWAASTVGALCMSREALWWSIDTLHAHLDMYDIEVWSILREQDMCTASVKEWEEVLAVEESMDDEVEMRKEKECYDAKRVMTSRQEVVERRIGMEARARVRASRMRRMMSPSVGLGCRQRRKVSVQRSRSVPLRPPFRPLGYMYIVVLKFCIIA